MRYWLAVASRDHVKAGVSGGFCQLCHGKHSAAARLSPGDRIVYYSPRTEMRGGESVQAFTAIGEILDREPYTCDMGNGFVPARRDVRFFAAVDAPIRPLVEQLSFTRGRRSWGSAFRFGLLEMTGEDYALIAAAMGIEAEKHAA